MTTIETANKNYFTHTTETSEQIVMKHNRTTKSPETQRKMQIFEQEADLKLGKSANCLNQNVINGKLESRSS